MAITQIPAVSDSQKRVDLFNASGTWVAPAGVTYAIATLVSGGGSGGTYQNGASGGNSSAFGTSHNGGGNGIELGFGYSANEYVGLDGRPNTGQGGSGFCIQSQYGPTANAGSNSTEKKVGSTVVPGTSYTITVGAGAPRNTTANNGWAGGGSGYVTIEYWIG